VFKSSSASTGNGLDIFIKILEVIFIIKSDMPVLIPGPDGHALPVQAAVIKPGESAASPHRNSLDIIPVPVVDRVPPLEHDLPLLDVQLPPPAAAIIIHHGAHIARDSHAL